MICDHGTRRFLFFLMIAEMFALSWALLSLRVTDFSGLMLPFLCLLILSWTASKIVCCSAGSTGLGLIPRTLLSYLKMANSCLRSLISFPRCIDSCLNLIAWRLLSLANFLAFSASCLAFCSAS